MTTLLSRPVTQAECESMWVRYYAQAVGKRWRYERRLWEHAVIARAGITALAGHQPRFLGFGVGTERLPAFFASLGANVIATDHPDERCWTRQHANGEARYVPGLLPEAEFRRRVTFRPLDMRELPADLLDGSFDLVWSACAIEHLGGLAAGAIFVRAAMRALRPGGLAIHTTEWNLSSDTETIDAPDLCLYRRCDLEALAADLAADGHRVALSFAAGDGQWDRHVAPSEGAFGTEHLRLQVGPFVTTSYALIIRRGVL